MVDSTIADYELKNRFKQVSLHVLLQLYIVSVHIYGSEIFSDVGSTIYMSRFQAGRFPAERTLLSPFDNVPKR